jgi:hypothetical protein
MTGCGNVFNSKYQQVPAGSFSYMNASAAQSAIFTPSDYTCSSMSNVLPQESTSGSDAESFTACPNKDAASTGNILVQGEISGTDSICVFPAKQTSSGAMSWYNDPQKKGSPIYSCAKMSAEGAAFSFPTLQGVTGFNALFIVSQDDSADMLKCLLTELAFCPFYFYGKFR